jgi:hypothetical protein
VPELVAPGLDGMGERLTRAVLDMLSDEDTRNDLIALFQAGTSTAKAAKGMQQFLEQSVVDRLVRYIGVPDARLRVNLIMSYLLGIATSRYILRLEPLASMSEDDVVRLVAPTVQNWLDPGKPLNAPEYNGGRGSAQK